MIHRLRRKAGRTPVAGVAIHAGAGQQLGLVGNVVGRLAQAGTTLVVAAGTGARADAGVAERGAGKTRVIFMTGVTGRRGGDMGRMFSQRIPLGVGTVVAGRALAGNHALGGGVTER